MKYRKLLLISFLLSHTACFYALAAGENDRNDDPSHPSSVPSKLSNTLSPSNKSSDLSENESLENVKEVVLKQSAYLEKHKDTLAILTQHSLVEGLSKAEVGEVHQKLVSYKLLKYFLAGVQQASKMQKDGPLPQDINQIRKYYVTLMERHRGITLFKILEEELKKSGALEEIKVEAKEIQAKKPKEDLAEIIFKLIHENDKYNSIMNAIRPVRNQETVYREALIKHFDARKVLLARRLASDITQENEESQRAREERYFSFRNLKNKLSGLFSWREQKVHPYKVITVDDVWKSVREKETQLLVCQSQDEDVSGEFNLAQFVNQKKYENLGDLDLIQVAKDLFESKKSRLTKEEKEFMDRYGEEVFAFKVNDEILQNHVFYSLPALIQKIRDRNHEILTGFFSQRKREER